LINISVGFWFNRPTLPYLADITCCSRRCHSWCKTNRSKQWWRIKFRQQWIIFTIIWSEHLWIIIQLRSTETWSLHMLYSC